MKEAVSVPRIERDPLWKLQDQIRESNDIDSIYQAIDAYLSTNNAEGLRAIGGKNIVNVLSTLKITDVTQADSIIDSLSQKYDLRPDGNTAAYFIDRSKTFEEAERIVQHFGTKYQVPESDNSVLHSLVQRTSPDVAIQIIEKAVPKGSELPESLIMHVLERAKNLRDAESVLTHFENEYQVAGTEKTLHVLLKKTNKGEDMFALIDRFTQGHTVAILGETILSPIVDQAKNAPEAESFVDKFREKYGTIPLTTVTLNRIVVKYNYLNKPSTVLDSLFKKYDALPTEGTYRLLLIKALSSPRPEPETIEQIQQLIAHIENKDGPITNFLFSTERFRVLYARYLFMEGKSSDAVIALTPILQKHIRKQNTRIVVAAMIFAFLPENHPLRMAMNENIQARPGERDLLDRSWGAAHDFSAIWSTWIEEERKLEGKYGGGTVFDDLHTAPVNRQAVKDILPQKRS